MYLIIFYRALWLLQIHIRIYPLHSGNREFYDKFKNMLYEFGVGTQEKQKAMKKK